MIAFAVGTCVGIFFGILVGVFIARAVDLQQLCAFRAVASKFAAWECPYSFAAVDSFAPRVADYLVIAAGRVSALLLGAAPLPLAPAIALVVD